MFAKNMAGDIIPLSIDSYGEEHDKDDFINPDAPVIVQFGDYGYEVFSVGGDPDLDNFVLMLKPQKVCEWKETGAFKLKGNK